MGKYHEIFKEEGDLGDISDILWEGAKYILKYTRPYTLARYLYNRDEDEFLKVARYILTNEPPNDDSAVYVLWGLMLYKQGQDMEAEAKYKKAIEVTKCRSYFCKKRLS